MQCTTYLIEVMGLPLSAQQSALPQTRTEGWILAHLLLGGYLVSSLAGRAREPDHGAGRHRTYRASLPITQKNHPGITPFGYWLVSTWSVMLHRGTILTRRLSMSDIWEGKAMPIYQIRLKEQLDEHWSAWFSGLMVTTRANGETLLTGEVVDQNGQIIPHTMNYAVAPAQAAMHTGAARLYVDAPLGQLHTP